MTREPAPRKPRRAKNTNRQGANFELQVLHDLEPHGYTCLRSSGSRGAVDVVAVSTDMAVLGARMNAGHHLIFIQCKITNPVIPPGERRALLRMAACANARPVVAHRVDGRVHYRELTGAGPKDWTYWFPTWCSCGQPDCRAAPDRPADLA
jgi:Holliday junction resolvase